MRAILDKGGCDGKKKTYMDFQDSITIIIVAVGTILEGNFLVLNSGAVLGSVLTTHYCTK